MIIQKARDVSTTRPNGEGPPPRPSVQPAPPRSAAPATPQLPIDQQAVVNDLATVTTNSTHKLSLDLMALAHGTQKPSQAVVDKLANDLGQALVGRPITAAQRARIALDIQTVFSGASSMPAERVEAFIVDVPLVLKVVGVESTYTAAIGNDLRSARKEVVPNPSPATAH